MDDTQQSRVSDAAAAATRKRRSSILKSQRPARTPFSELEFNVATPTDTAKSRRVSFSRRTGVAEFVTNEATTTWKNFYEEHNKSLESSSNDSEANASRQPVGHLGKRIFDQQFEEVEAVDFISGLANVSINNVNFTQQLASLEFTAEDKLTAPQNKFELSAFTEQSKLFGNNLTAPSIGENSGRIDVNFSAIQLVEKDDLDEIEKDLGRGSTNMGCHGPFSDRQNMSEYIEVDLNMTHVVKNDEDMSITDTVHSPVQDVSRSASIDKKVSLNNDWATDKENIAINPYAAPCESNFASNEEPDQVLVFDGKRLVLQPDIPEKDKNYRQTLLPNSSAETPQRKTIVLNVNDDLPNFIDSSAAGSGFHEIKSNEDEISNTVPVINRLDNTGNISMTQALPTNIICPTVISQDVNITKRRTIVFNESTNNISVTEAVPMKLLEERRRTVVYEDDTGNISITQAVPSNILVNEREQGITKHKTIVYDEDEDNISITQALKSNILDDNAYKRKTVFNDETCNISVSLALSNTVQPDKLTQEKRRTILYENETGNISVTQALPNNVILQSYEQNPERRRTIVYEADTGNISVTQAIPSNILLESVQFNDRKETKESDSDPANITAKVSPTARRRTIVYENETGNISITQAIPTQLIPGYSEDNIERSVHAFNTSMKPRNKKRTTIVYDNDEGDISMTEAISANIIEKATKETRTIAYDEDEADISKILAISANVFLLDKLDSAEDQTAKRTEELNEVNEKVIHNVYEDDSLKPRVDILEDDLKLTDSNAANCESEMSTTMAIPKVQILREGEKRKTVIFDNDNCDISMTKPIPAELLTFESELLNKFKSKSFDVTEHDEGANQQSDVIVLQASVNSSQPKLQSSLAEEADLQNTRDILLHKSITSDIEDLKMTSFHNIDEVTSDALLHPAVEEKIDQINLITPGAIVNLDVEPDGNDDAVTQTNENKDLTHVQSKETEESVRIKKLKESLLTTLLNMSGSTINSDTEDKNLMTQMESNHSCENLCQDTDYKTSTESMFYITKECEGDTQTDRDNDSVEAKSKMQETEEVVEIDELKIKLAELQTAVAEKNELTNRLRESIDITELEDAVERDENSKTTKNYNADNTQELLEMISNFTDNKESDDDDFEPVVVRVKSQDDVTEHKRLSFAPNRQSIALSREDLLNNISMAQAALQKSRLALDDSDCLEEDTKDVTGDVTKNSDRTSNEVVKTLQFDDESISETSALSEEIYSPLKKTAFGETSYMNETKSHVIPSYLRNVTDGIKDLMLDLVKPVNDNLALDNGLWEKHVSKNPTTQNTHAQANLTASSQVDVHSELYTECSSSVLNKSKSRPLPSPVKYTAVCSENSSKFDDPKDRYFHPDASAEPPSEVLVFDHLNPLNNILLAPMNYSDAHRYNPKKTDEKLCGFEGNRSIGTNVDTTRRENEYEMKHVSTTLSRSTVQEDIEAEVSKPAEQSVKPTVSSRPLSTDQSIDAISTQLRDDEVNTIIAMKGNKELLAGSSSLTLVDAIDTDNRPCSPPRVSKNLRIKFSTSPTTIEMDDAADMYKVSEISLQERIDTSRSKGKKRFYSPSVGKYKDYQVSVEVTPKPINKMQKISNSPKLKHNADLVAANKSTRNMTPEKDNSHKNVHTAKICEKSPKKQLRTPGQTITVQQLITDYQVINSEFEHTVINSENMVWDKLNVNSKSKSPTVLFQSDDSFTSSNNFNLMEDGRSTSTMESRSPRQSSMPSQDWGPDLLCASNSNMSEADSGVNVVAKIDMLPFMGSHECEWESSVGDTWSFRLLHGRLRLTTQLGHRHDNAMRTRVRGDTPVLDIAVDTVQHDRKNPVATMCVRFACDTMRYFVSHTLRTTCCASDIPLLLRRCAAVARVALRWGRAMHNAKLHLAYTVDSNGNLSLKVANIPLRSVWEVTMRIELVLDDKDSSPWARAGRVRVARVVSDVLVPDAEVRRALAHTPRDWGHAPRTIWRIFKYLKHKTRDENLIVS